MLAHNLPYGDNHLSMSFLLPSRKLFFLKQHDFRLNFDSRRKCFRISASSAKKPRRKSNVKSNEELCNEIREFMSAVGLPEGHFPTMKEFSAHGRTDLGNIVRRRGYKVVRDLLSNSMKSDDSSGLNIEQNVAKKKMKSIILQDEKVGDIVENSSSIVVEDPKSSYGDDDHISAEWKTNKVSSTVRDFTSSTPSHNIPPQNEETCDDGEALTAVEGDSSSREVLIMVKFDGDLNLNSETNFDAIACLPEETSDSYLPEEKDRKILQGQDEKGNFVADDVSMAPGVSYSEYPANGTNVVTGLNSKSMDLVANTSLEDKVAKFIQHGDLDNIEDDVYGTLDERTEESERSKAFEIETEIEPKSPFEENFEHAAISSDAASASNTSKSEQTTLQTRESNLFREGDFAPEDVASSDMMKNVDDEIDESDNQVEINRLKFLLHQKELELSHLKDQIEKEKLSLSNLRKKTETEIIKAQKQISKKEAQLLAAEESLSGLVEVNIQYGGEGEIVEVAGSFNGWHHPIKMDPQPSTGSKKFRLWSTTLWLYPGVYEIKFILDGEWTVDEERESVSKGGICNNILRVVG